MNACMRLQVVQVPRECSNDSRIYTSSFCEGQLLSDYNILADNRDHRINRVRIFPILFFMVSSSLHQLLRNNIFNFVKATRVDLHLNPPYPVVLKKMTFVSG